ncbi:MAG TPA: prepilin-type N-terminal cleavage/methylation domain-containing protein [Candidatus Portnoybacteria bacterium]|nr:prepilin-type N-terminal cleavage/methylation domain-containing protein [Candidatus Portnoybacteria bacterium]
MKEQKKSYLTKGFTLIELLVVISIIGILATIVMVSLNTARAKARDARRISDIRQVQLALQMYYDASGSYPAALSTLTPTYLSAVPLDPDGTNSYQYCVSATKGYHLGTKVAGLEALPNTALNSDADAAAADCATSGFAGTDPVYDVTP